MARDLWHMGAGGRGDPEAADREPRAATPAARAPRRSSTTGPSYRAQFVKVFPKEYRRALGELARSRGRFAANGKVGVAADMGKVTGFLEYQRLQEAAEAPRGAQEALPRVRRAPDRRGGDDPGRALHGLRHPVLHERLPGQQHHPGLERPRLQAGLAAARSRRCTRPTTSPSSPAASAPRRARRPARCNINNDPVGHQVDRARDHRQGLGGGLGRCRSRPRTRPARRVAVVGSGPAGLACAQQLARAGHDVVVFEKNDRIGGLLRYGIPDFKMEKWLIDRRIEQMRAEGVEFRTGVFVGTAPPGSGIANDAKTTIGPEQLARRVRRGGAAPAAPSSRATCRCPGASSTASTSRWSSCRCRTGASPATTAFASCGRPASTWS